MKRCPKCGAENRDYAKQCLNCGCVLSMPNKLKNNNSSKPNKYDRYLIFDDETLRTEPNFAAAEAECNSIIAPEFGQSLSRDPYVQINQLRKLNILKKRPSGSNIDSDTQIISDLSLPNNILHHLQTSIKNIYYINSTKMPEIMESNKEGSAHVLKNDNHRIMQAYASKYPYRQVLPLVKLVKLYNLPIYDLKHKLRIINSILDAFSNSHFKNLHIPDGVKEYSKYYNNYLYQVQGAQGEDLACQDLTQAGYSPIAHDVNIPFNYSQHYKYLCNYLQQKLAGTYSKQLYGVYKYYRKLYYRSLRNDKSRNNNQIDILYTNNGGIYLFEVKNYDHNKIWINKNGQIAWQNPKYKNGPRINHQDDHSLSISQQFKLHDIALLNALKRSQQHFTNRELKLVQKNLFNILVYVKKDPHKHILGGVYKYDRSLKDYSDKYHIYPYNQNNCAKAIQGVSEQYIFNPDLVRRLRAAIMPESERSFKLPIFKRENVHTLNQILNYKNEINYVFKTLRHICYQKHILYNVVGKNSYDYKKFLRERDKQHQLLRYWDKRASYQYYSHEQNKWLTAKNKSNYTVQKYHKEAVKQYNMQKKIYDDFYK